MKPEIDIYFGAVSLFCSQIVWLLCLFTACILLSISEVNSTKEVHGKYERAQTKRKKMRKERD